MDPILDESIPDNLMVLASLIAVVVVIALLAALSRRKSNATQMGRMSDQWLAEHRASHGP